MSTFLDLPVEAVDLILAFSDNDQVEALSRVSKSLRQLAEPHLYHEITLEINDDDYIAKTDPLAQLLRTLENRRELYSAIKRLVLELDDYDSIPSTAREFSANLEDVSFMKGGHFVTFRAALVHFFRKLRGLEYIQIPLGCASLFDYLLEFREYSLRSLRTVCYSPFPQISTWNRREAEDTRSMIMRTFLHAPLLKTVDVVLPLNLPLPLRASPLKTLILRHSGFSPASLGTLLAATITLEKLQYDYDCDLDMLHRFQYNCVNDWGKLREGLKCVAGTLRHLSIALDFHFLEDYKDDDWDPKGSWGLRGRLGDITFLEKLESLEVPLPALLGWNPRGCPSLNEVLPTNLVALGLRDDLLDWIEQYPWTPWDSNVIGRFLDSSFHDTVECSAVLNQLRTIASNSETKLKNVTLLMSNRRLWPRQYLTQFTAMFNDTKIGIDGIKVLLRMDDEDALDLVKEITFQVDFKEESWYQETLSPVERSQDQEVTFWVDDTGRKRQLNHNSRQLRLPARTLTSHT
jgi:hypothetical protein